MRALFIHADFIEYEAKKKTKVAEKISDSQKKGRFEEVLVAFISFEQRDEGKETESSKALVANVIEIAGEVKAERIVLYPYAHLSSSLAKADTCVKILHAAEHHLKEQGYEVHASPFGWYKSFDISCKGHPLSELSREIVAGETETGEEEISEAVKAEKAIKSTWLVLDAEGNEHELALDDNGVTGYDFKDRENFRKFCHYEMAKSRVSKGEPPHIDLMRRLELVDYEPGSDPGNFRYYPKGKMIKSLLERYVTDMVKKTGGMEVETPIMYDFEHPSLKEYMNRFPARQYTIQTPDKKVFLRFAACFGQFMMLHDDCHSFAADLEMAKSEAKSRFGLTWDILSGIGFDIPGDLEFAIRATREFHDNNKEFLVDLVKTWGKPALVEIWSERFFYFVFKYEWNFVDVLEKASALNTDQIDVENAERYGITYVGSDGKRHHPLILHQSPSGAVERLIYALLERAHLHSLKGMKPKLPYWLSPTQVRLIPVTDEFVEDCAALAAELPARADVDDRDMTVGKKIRDAEREWVDLIIVYGEKEKAGGLLQVRVRGEDKKAMSIGELQELLSKKLGQMPFEPLPLPTMLSQRIIFRG
jgi:threonyl-tRNA synthetase